MEQFTALSAYVYACLGDLPLSPAEPINIDFVSEAISEVIGVVSAMPGFFPTAVALSPIPPSVQRGRSLELRLALADHDANGASIDHELDFLAQQVWIEARLHSASPAPSSDFICESCDLPVEISAVASRRLVAISLKIPESCPDGSIVELRRLAVSGRPLHLDAVYIAVRHGGMDVPLRLDDCAIDEITVPAVALDGTLYVPKGENVLVFSHDGHALHPIAVEDFGFSEVCVVALVDDDATLLLSSASSNTSVVALDLASRDIKWKQSFEGDAGMGISPLMYCYGMGIDLHNGVVLVSSNGNSCFSALRISDGKLLSQVSVHDPSLAVADASSGTVYFNSDRSVSALSWDSSSTSFSAPEDVKSIEATTNNRLVAVVPSASSCAHLVVGTYGRPDLCIFSLPDCRLVRKHCLKDVEVTGLASDPTGTCLVVCDCNSMAVHVLPWPLEGAPVSQ